MTVLAGHGRLLACKQLGYTELPVIRLSHLSEAQAKAFAIAENRLVETGAWDDALLAEVLQELSAQDLDFDLDVTGFSLPEIDIIIEGLDDGEADDADDAPIDLGPSVVRPGELWRLGDHRLLCGSSLEVDNPSGRPKRVRTQLEVTRRELAQKVIVTENGRKRRLTKAELFTKQLVNKALKGEPSAMRMLLRLGELMDAETLREGETAISEKDQRNADRNVLDALAAMMTSAEAE